MENRDLLKMVLFCTKMRQPPLLLIPCCLPQSDSTPHTHLHWSGYATNTLLCLQVNFISYQDELASEIGVKPRLWSLLLKDPVLAWCLFFGPACPYQYRLSGPGAWDGARDAILTVDKRIWYPLSKEFAVKQSTFSYFAVLVILCFIFAVISILSSS